MKEFLNWLDHIPSRVDFLTHRLNDKNGYIHIAADVYKTAGETYEAAKLLLDYGFANEASELFKLTGYRYDRWFCSLLSISMRINEHEDGRASFVSQGDDQDLQKQLEIITIEMKRSNDMQSKEYGLLGEAYLLLGKLTCNQEFIQKAFNNFVRRHPKNYVGKLECLNWMVHQSDFKNYNNISRVVKGIQDLFQLLQDMMHKSKEATIVQKQVMRDFGVLIDVKSCKCNAYHKPRIWRLLGEGFSKSVSTAIGSDMEIKDRIVTDLLKKGKNIFCTTRNKLLEKQKEISLGNRMNQNRICLMQIETSYQKSLEDLICILPKSQTKVLENFLAPNQRYTACQEFFDEVMGCINKRKFPLDLSKKLEDGRKPLKVFLVDKLHKLRTTAAISESVCTFVIVETLIRFCDIDIDIRYELTAVETCFKNLKIHGKLGFIVDKSKHLPESIVRNFSSSLMSFKAKADPFRALKCFSCFITEIKKQDPLIIYDTSMIRLWMEYFMVLSFTLQSKYYSESTKSDFPLFIIPKSWFKTIQIVNQIVFKANEMDTNRMLAIFKFKTKHTATDIEKMSVRTLEAIIGFRGRFSFIDVLLNKFQKSFRKTPQDMGQIASLELEIQQLLAICLVCVLNMGKWLPVDYEIHVLRKISLIRQQNKLPERIHAIIVNLCEAGGISDLLTILENLCRQSGDQVSQYFWEGRRRQILISEKKCYLMREFHDPNTKLVLRNPEAPEPVLDDHVNTEEPDFTMDEDVKDYMSDQTKDEKTTIKNVQGQREQKEEDIIIDELRDDFYFSEVILNEERCDVCGVLFNVAPIYEGDDTLLSPYIPVSPSAQITTNPFVSLQSIARSLSSSSGEFHADLEDDNRSHQTGAKMRNDSSEDGDMSSPTKLDTVQVSILDTGESSNVYDNRNPRDEHNKSHSHKSRLRSFHGFQRFYMRTIKPEMTKTESFIDKYGLSSETDIQKFKGDNVRINKFVKTFEDLKSSLIAFIRDSKKWDETEKLKRRTNTVAKMKKDIKESVKNSHLDSTIGDDDDELKYRGIKLKRAVRRQRKH